MVAVVGGAGLGLANMSREIAGAAAGLGEAALGRGPDRATLNAATGNLVLQSRDEFLVGAGADIELLRTYNSQGGWDGDNADGWRIGYYRRVSGLAGTVNTAGSTVRRIEADGHEAVYAWDGSRYVGRDGAGAHDTLVFDTATRVWTWTDGDTALKERYAETAANSGQFRLVQVTDTEGHATKIAYDGAGLISSVSSWKAGAGAADESVVLQYDAARRLTQLTTQYKDAAGAPRSRVHVRYEYDAAGRLAFVRTDLTPQDGQVADGNVYTVRYGYDAAGRLASVVQGDGSSLAISYDAAGRVRQLRDALGRNTTLDYDLAARRTTVTDALGQLTVLSFDAADRLVDIAGAAAGGGTLHHGFGYDADGNLVSSRNPQGEETAFEPTSQGVVGRSTDAAGNVVERSYDAGNRLIAEVRYLAPDADGAAGPALPSGALRTRYLYDTSGGRARLRFVIDPEGRVTQLDYNALGQVSVRTRYADAVYAATGEPALTDLVAWSGGLTAAQRAAVERVEYGYDLRGQQSLVRTYAANSVSGGSVVYGGLAEQRYVYDAFGRLLQAIDALGRSTAWAYDGMDRLSATTDAAGTVTLTRHDDDGRRVALQLANGLERVSSFDAAGRLISSVEQAPAAPLGETRYHYDGLDRLVMTQDAEGLRRWTLYDVAGRRSAEVDGTGHFIEYAYDAAGRLVQTIDHAVRVSAAALAGLVDANAQPVARAAAELRPAADALRDRIETRFYDRAGRLVAVQAADGAVTETQYDGASRAVATVAYANVSAVARVDLSAGSTLATPPALAAARPVGDPARDRTARSFYSDAGLLRATLDAEGYLVERRYDAAGRLVERLEYANATAAALRASGTLAQLLPGAGPADRRCVYFHDGQGRQVGELDADGYLTETVYDVQGNRRQSIRYATPVLQAVTAGAALAAVRPAASASDRSTRWDVDALGRVQRETAANGSVTRHDYDALGRLVASVRAEGTAEERTQTRRFDLQGRVVAELSAEGAALLATAQTSGATDAIWAAHGSRITYDAAGRRTSRREANGSLTLYYHDAAGREVCSILETAQGGEVRQTAYNAFGEAETITSYANRLAPAELSDLAGGAFDAELAARVAALFDAARDLRSTTLRTRRGQVAQTIDALGARTDTQYTAFGEIAATQQDVSGGTRLATTQAHDRRGLLLVRTADPGGIGQVTRSGYDAFGRLSSTTDARGQVTGYAYAKASLASGRSVIETGPDGARSTVYDAFGGVLQQTDALDHTVRYAYDPAARRMTMTTAENIVVVTETTRHGEVARVTDGNGAVTTYAYDRDGHLLMTTDGAGNVEQHRYDAGGRRVATTIGLKTNGTAAPLDTGGTTLTETVYDAADRVLIRRVDPNGLRLETRYEYDGRGLAVKITDPAGVITTHAFDAAGRLRESVVDSAPGGLQLRTAYSYDAQGRILRMSEGADTAEARTVETRYDALGRRTTEIVDPDGLALTRRWEYDPAGHVVLERDPLGQPTRHVYDAAGRLALSIDATGAVTQRLYDAEGRLTGLRAYAQRLGGTTTPDLSPAALSDAQVRSAVAALAGASDTLTQYVLDRDGRVVYTIDAAGAVTKNRYDKADRVVETIRYATLKPGTWTGSSTPAVDAARDQSTLTVYDAAGRLRYVVDALDFVTETAYDRQGRVVMVKRCAQSIARPAAATEASIASAVAARLDAANDRTEYSAYDAAGRLRFAVDAEGYVTERRHDALGRVTDTLRSQVRGSFAAAPGLAAAEAAFRTTRSFTGSAGGLTGTAHVYEANRIRLVSRPESGGGTATTRGTAVLETGASVAFDLVPLRLQPDLTVALESPVGASQTRFGLVLGSDGRLDARIIDRASGIDQRVDIGAYVAGASYRVEIVTSEGGGAVLYVYERGKARDTGIVYRCDEPLSWTGFSVLFQASRDAALTAESSALVDDLVESRAAWLAQQRYDAAGRRVASIDGEGVVTRYTWDAAARLVDTVAAAGRAEASTTRRVYDAAGRLIEETAAHGTGAASTTRYEWNAAGRLVARVDPRGLALARSDSAWAQSERAALGFPPTLAGLGAAQKQALSDRYTTRYEYDAAGRRIRSSEPQGRISTVDYDAFGRAVRMTEPGGSGMRVSYTFYDRLGRAVQEVDAERYLTAKSYDGFGNLLETVRYDGRVAGTLAPQSSGNASIAVGGADPGDGRAFVIASPAADAASRLTYDRRNQRLTERDAEGYVEGTLEALDAFGQSRSAVNRLGGRSTFVHDRLGRLTRETLPVRAAKADGTLVDVVHQYAYDSRGNRVLSIEAVGLPEQRTTRFRFDNEHRQVLRTGMAYIADDGRSVTPADRLRYDALGRVVEELTAGQLVDNAVVGGRRSLAWHDARGLRTAELSADAVLAQFTYDPAGQVVIHRIAATRVASPPTRPGGAAPVVTASGDDRRLSYVYDALGRRTETWLDGVWHWEFGQPVTLAGAERIALERLAYDTAGNAVQRTDARGNASYAYFDRLGRRLLAIDAEGYVTAWDYGRSLMQATRETRFAGRLAGGYARQDDATAAPAARDPQALRSAAAQASAALPVGETEADRVTSYRLDRLGRMVERRLAGVTADDVSADGTRRQRVADAITQMEYDGLGQVVQTRELLCEASDPDGWEVTGIDHDLLGREVARSAPGFVDYRGVLVRPSTELELDGLGRIERRIERGTTAGSEADDRISGYRYGGNGRLVEETDAAGAVTRYAYDAAGNLALRTAIAVRRSDGSSRDLGTRYAYDAAGRVVAETDLDTGELRRTRYNAFGEVSGRGLGDGWQEFAEYTTLGKVWKTNAGDGAVKIYLHDRNGNTTREIKAAAAVDLRATSLAAASRDESLLHTSSVYDKRGLLRQTLEPEFALLASTVTLGQQFVEQWVPQYGDLNAAATTSQQASIQDGQRYTTVSAGSAALTPLSAATPGFTPSVDGIVLGTAPVQADPPVPAVMRWHALSYALPDGVFRTSAASIAGFWTYVYLPDDWPAGEYRVTETVGTDAVVITTTAAPGGPVKIGNLHGSTRTRSLQFDYRFASTEPWAPIATAQYTKDMDYESYTVEWGGLTVSAQPNRRVVLDTQVWAGASSFKVFLDPDGGAPTALAVKAFGTSTRFDAVDLPATLTGAHTLRIVALDASGNVLRGGDYAVGTSATDASGNPLPADVSTLAPKTSTGLEKGSDGFVWVDYTGATRTLRYQSSGTNLGAGVALRYRRAVTNGRGGWSSVALSANGADLKPLALADGSYEFVVEFGGTNADLYRYGKFTVKGGSIVVPNSMLQRLTRRSELVDIAGTSGGLVSLNVGGYTASAYVASGATSVRFDLGALREKLGIDRWESGTAAYAYTSKDAAGKVTHADRGTFSFGPSISVPSADDGNAVATTDGVTEYQPEALVTVAGAAGRVVVTPKTGGGTSANWSADGTDWHVRRQGDGLIVNLRQWLPAWGAAANTVQLRYEGNDGLVATVDFTVASNGTVTRASTVVQQTYKPELPLVVPGATTMRVFKVGIDDASVDAATVNEAIGGTGPNFVWNASSRLGQTLRYYYEAVDAAGKLVGKGRGKVVVSANGDITQTPDPPLPIPYVRFSPPAGTSSFTLQIRPQGSTAAYTAYTTGWTAGSDRVYDFDAKRPASGSASYDYLFTAKDAGGKVLTKGSGTLAIQSSGAIAVTNVEEHVAVPVLFTLGRQVPKALLTVERNGVRTTATLLGTWVPPVASADGSPGRLGYTRFEWDAAAMGSSAGITVYDYTLVAQDAAGTTVLDEIGRAVAQAGRIELDPNGSQPVQLLEKVEALNGADSVVVSRLQSHNAFGEVIEERDERVADRMADMLGRALSSAEQASARTTLRYDTRGRLISKTDPQTHVTLANGYRGRERPVTRYGYDLLGRLTTVTDANGNLSRRTSLAGARGDDSAGTREFLPDGGQRQTGYDVFGDARRLVDAEGHVVEQRFDGLSRLLQSDRIGVRRVVDDAGTRGTATTLSSRYTYDQLGRRLSQTDAAGQTIRTDYDGLGRVVRTVSGQGFETSYGYEVVAAGANGGVLGVGGVNVGGIRLTTTLGSGRSTIDKIDYFGHTTWHRDLGGADTVYSYDRAARLVAQTGGAHAGQPAAQDIRYAYYANGFVQSVTDRKVGSVSEYGYDNAGNRVYEAYFQLVDGNKNANYQNATLTYDELNRLAGVRDSNYFDIRYEYDAKGNRRLVESVYWDGLAGLRSGRQAYWYDYDGMDRFVVAKGTLSGARATSRTDATVRVVAGAEGTVLAYDRLGQRRSATYGYDGQQVVETYDYSEDGYLETVRQAGVLKGVRVLDAIGRTLQYHDKQNRTSTVSTYDADSRLLQQVYTDAVDGANSGTTTYAYYTDASDSASSAGGAGALAKTVFTPDEADETFVTTSYRYVYWDEAKQSEITKQADRRDLPTWYPGRSFLYYNANGHLERVWDQVAQLDTRYSNSANGLILKREKLQNGTRVGSHFYYYAGGRRVGDVSDDPGDNPRISYAEQLATKRDELPDARKLYKTFKPVRSSDFDQNFEPINESYPAAAPSNYTVRDAQDLQGIASQLWGDRSMWYLIAEANGLRGDETLVSGQVLVIPNKVTNIHNNAETFRPYNPGEAIGRIDPTLPPPPMPQSGGCGDMGVVVSAAIAIAVAAATGGAAGTSIASLLGVTAGTTTTIAGYAAGAALGSVAGQAFNVAADLQQGFSWRQVAESALAGAIGSGVSEVVGKFDALAFLKEGSFASVGRAAIGTGIDQVLHGDWDWRGVMAAAVGAGVSGIVSEALQDVLVDNAAGKFGQRLIASAAAATAETALGQTPDIGRAFGNALGISLTEGTSIGYQGEGTSASPYVNPDTGEHIVFDNPYQPDYPVMQRIVGALSHGFVQPPVDRTDDVLLAASDGFTTGRGPVSIGQRGRTVYIAEQGVEPSIDAMLAKALANLKELQRLRDEALTAELNRNSVIRETVTPIFEVPVEIPPVLSEAIHGVGDAVAAGIIGMADLTVAPLVDIAATGFKALHGAVTGDYQPLTTLSSYADGVASGAGFWEGIKTTGTNVFNVSPVGMIYHAGTGSYGLTTAAMNGDLREATRQGLELGLNFAGTVVPLGMTRSPSRSFLVEAEASALHRIAAKNRAATPWADLRRAYQQARGDVDFAHIEADVSFKANGRVKAQGGHFSTSPQLQRFPDTETVSPNGVIYGQVRLLGPDGNFHVKTNNGGFSSMTPDSWSLARAKGEMSQAWVSRSFDPVDGIWTGSSSGIDFVFHEPTNRAPMWRGYPVRP